MDLKRHYAIMADYNAWANTQLLEAAAALSPEQLAHDTGCFFHSMQGTLNHLLVADRLWLKRMTGDGPTHARLDEVPYPALADLHRARVAEDQRLIRLIENLTPEMFSEQFRYQNMAGEWFEQEYAPVLAHVFNHQTHHRGQAHSILMQLTGSAPALDLIYYWRRADRTTPTSPMQAA